MSYSLQRKIKSSCKNTGGVKEWWGQIFEESLADVSSAYLIVGIPVWVSGTWCQKVLFHFGSYSRSQYVCYCNITYMYFQCILYLLSVHTNILILYFNKCPHRFITDGLFCIHIKVVDVGQYFFNEGRTKVLLKLITASRSSGLIFTLCKLFAL